jgi:hypothetical protein
MRHDGSVSPQVAQQGGTNGLIEDQQGGQTAPRVGASRGSLQTTHTGAMSMASAASAAARATTPQPCNVQLRNVISRVLCVSRRGSYAPSADMVMLFASPQSRSRE